MKTELIIELFVPESLELIRKIRERIESSGGNTLNDIEYDNFKSLIISAILAKDGLDKYFCSFTEADESILLLRNLDNLQEYYKEILGENPKKFFAEKFIPLRPTLVSA